MDSDFNFLNGDFMDADGDDLFGDNDEHDELPEGSDMSMDVPETSMAMQPDQDIGDTELNDLLNEGKVDEDTGFDLNNLNDYVLDVGEKAADAVDYEDVSDDDLPDEEEEPQGGPVHPPAGLLEGVQDAADIDDLFGDGEEHDDSFLDQHTADGKSDIAQRREDADSVASEHTPVVATLAQGTLSALGQRDEGMSEEDQRNFRLQMALLSGAGQDQLAVERKIDDMDAWLRLEFPDFDRNDNAPFWNKLLPPKPGRWQGKEPKKPKPIRPTKVTLDIEPDQKTLFTAPAAVAAPFDSRTDLVYVTTERGNEQLETLSDDYDSDDDLPNGMTMQDLQLMCTDFDTLSHPGEEDEILMLPEPRIVGEDTDMYDHEVDYSDYERPLKKRRLGLNAKEIVTMYDFELPPLDDPEKLTAKIARDVVLDLNDSKLLVEEVDQEAVRQRTRPGEEQGRKTSIKERLAHRFKTSNDAAYNLLQQNQKKVRGQLSNMTIDHSVPAVRLQYPYYQVKLAMKDLRNWHRKQIQFKSGIAFSRVNKQKRKDFKNKPTREAFAKTRDLSTADNSYVLLLEYSEEHPLMLSQTGMGNKVVNYYRKLDSNDTARPKSEIGDTSVLMPEDKSPFNNFGHIDPGESTLALYNSMYRAPIFKQTQCPQDFLIVREVTGLNGQIHYLRNIDYQYVVGQELPSVAVPGTHSRMVTTASKNRLKAISFRIARRKKSHRIRVEEVTRHFPDTNDMQNRQKMKEFMKFNKEHKEWEMANQEPIPDEEDIQKYNKPEDICLLESMQVGAQYLADSGYADDEDGDDDDDNDKKNKDKELSIEQELAPWKTTKNFLQATQGKAMLRLYGEGDPSGRGEAFSFIKISMKGGFKPQGLSANENVDKQRGKGEGGTAGHSYSVARQQKSYEDSIRSIWEKQKAVLSSQIEADDIDDEGVDGQIEEADRSRNVRATPISGTPVRRRDDETGTSFSKRSTTSQAQRYLKVTRRQWNAREEEWEEKEVIESDPQVIKRYLKLKELQENRTRFVPFTLFPLTCFPLSHCDAANIHSIHELAPTGDPEKDARAKKRIEEELAKLTNSKQRRRKKGPQATMDAGSPVAGGAGSPAADGDPSTPAPASSGKGQPTQRKCANCGQVGHIKTNKKLVSGSIPKSVLCGYCGLSVVEKVVNAFAVPLVV
ncbi:hypothetical protein H2198_006872 [Neophaeococcomyces mojaviensis]|uniref:Uncharacterized protein n=1 Tax=Neophaeococcomyces mojaviensis TaxID=3383035 RepID=A0ACC3A1N6_9EURO|nr:hypothetical protein H2198_006872 [Knufia sp. JES_112]